MFGRNKSNNTKAQELRDLEIEKNIINREIELYRREKFNQVDNDIETHKIKRLKEVAELEIQCHRQLGEYEHEFHSTKEIRGIELARVEAKIEALNSIEPTLMDIISNKDKEIERLVNIINALTNHRTKK
jgi:hypothetical protein